MGEKIRLRMARFDYHFAADRRTRKSFPLGKYFHLERKNLVKKFVVFIRLFASAVELNFLSKLRYRGSDRRRCSLGLLK